MQVINRIKIALQRFAAGAIQLIQRAKCNHNYTTIEREIGPYGDRYFVRCSNPICGRRQLCDSHEAESYARRLYAVQERVNTLNRCIAENQGYEIRIQNFSNELQYEKSVSGDLINLLNKSFKMSRPKNSFGRYRLHTKITHLESRIERIKARIDNVSDDDGRIAIYQAQIAYYRSKIDVLTSILKSKN